MEKQYTERRILIFSNSPMAHYLKEKGNKSTSSSTSLRLSRLDEPVKSLPRRHSRAGGNDGMAKYLGFYDAIRT